MPFPQRILKGVETVGITEREVWGPVKTDCPFHHLGKESRDPSGCGTRGESVCEEGISQGDVPARVLFWALVTCSREKKSLYATIRVFFGVGVWPNSGVCDCIDG